MAHNIDISSTHAEKGIFLEKLNRKKIYINCDIHDLHKISTREAVVAKDFSGILFYVKRFLVKID